MSDDASRDVLAARLNAAALKQARAAHEQRAQVLGPEDPARAESERRSIQQRQDRRDEREQLRRQSGG